MTERVKTGITGLDEMLGGGFYTGSTTVIKGAPGAGKTCFGIQFIAGGCEEKQPGLIVTFEEFPEQLHRDAKSIGFDLKKCEKAGLLKIVLSSPDVFVSSMREPGGRFDELIVENKIQRVVIDSLTHLEGLSTEPSELRQLVYGAISGLRRYGVTAILTQEAGSIIGETSVSNSAVSHIADNLILLRFVEMDSGLKKAIVIVKERGSDHDKGIREYEITGQGVKIKLPFKDQEGILSGTPHRVAKEMAKFFKE